MNALDRRRHRVRRITRPVHVGAHLVIGGDAPIAVQSMCTTPTADVAATLAQAVALAEAGCELVRVTVPTVADAAALAPLRAGLDAAGWARVPLCADVHFQARAALAALEHVEKVRINPGNFAGAGRAAREADDAGPLLERLGVFYARARALGRAVRIGVNHGSLAERILRTHGNTPQGMVASALECARAAEAVGCRDVVISLKASDPRIMVRAYRLLVEELAAAELPVPLHLGVTEAGAGMDGMIRSAAGIGALLADGIGDTLRVSLTGDPVAEIPVARALARRYAAPADDDDRLPDDVREAVDPLAPRRRATAAVDLGIPVGGDAPVAVAAPGADDRADLPRLAWAVGASPGIVRLDLPDTGVAAHLRGRIATLAAGQVPAIGDTGRLSPVTAYRLLAALLAQAGDDRPLCLALLAGRDPLILAADAGGLLMDGIGEVLYLPAADDPAGTGLAILQATRLRLSRVDVIACPGCGRTLFDLAGLAERVRARFDHLAGLTLGVMGCIVNGPGEMADADYGLVGAGPDAVDLYRDGAPVRRQVPLAGAVAALEVLLREDGRWREP